MLIISYDAVGDSDFERLMEYPAFSAFARQSAVFRGVPTMCPSNTYPVHTSIVTGVVPRFHGLRSNTEPFPQRSPVWNNHESSIKARTLWQAAAEQGVKTATVFWPVTGYSKSIRYNIPEMMPRPGKNPLFTLLLAGSLWFQLLMLLRHWKLLKGLDQPARDNFAAACMADILRKRKPGLALMHLTAFDSICHKYGRTSDELNDAFEALDRNLAILLEAAGDRDVMILSDHSQIDVQTPTEPNRILVEAGLMAREEDAWIPGESGCYIECCGGTAFFHAGSLPESKIAQVREQIEQSEGFRRFLSAGEMSDSGYGDAAFGFCAQAGYSLLAFSPGHKAEHGYPADMPDYKVFYMARGFGLQPGAATGVGSLLDIAPLAAGRLGIKEPDMNGGNNSDAKTR